MDAQLLSYFLDRNVRLFFFLVDRHLRFHFLAVTNDAAVNFCVQIFVLDA